MLKINEFSDPRWQNRDGLHSLLPPPRSTKVTSTSLQIEMNNYRISPEKSKKESGTMEDSETWNNSIERQKKKSLASTTLTQHLVWGLPICRGKGKTENSIKLLALMRAILTTGKFHSPYRIVAH